MYKRILSLFLVAALFIGNFSFAEAKETIPYENSETKEEILENLASKKKLTEKQTSQLSETLQILDNAGATIECIEDVRFEGEKILFVLELDESTTSELEVKKTITNDVIVNVVENDIHNEVILKSDGTRYLDGKKIDGELVVNTTSVGARTGGFNWYKYADAPSYLINASYGSYTLTQSDANVPLTNVLKSIAYESFKMVIAAYSGLSPEFVDMTFAIFDALRTNSPNSDALSFKVYTAKCTTNPRYLRRYTDLYPKVNFQGTRQTSVRYGVLI